MTGDFAGLRAGLGGRISSLQPSEPLCDQSQPTLTQMNEKVERNGRFSCESKHGPCGGEQLHGVALVRYKTIWKYEIIDKSAIPANSIFFFQAGHLFTSCTWGEKPELKEERKF